MREPLTQAGAFAAFRPVRSVLRIASSDGAELRWAWPLQPLESIGSAKEANVEALSHVAWFNGGVLVDYDGMTLYTFDRDAAGHSRVNAEAAETWPPLLVKPRTAGGRRLHADHA
ncbi:hypothetical protein ABT040_35720 [Streptomyces sp. NPDC002688]|uniref:hypothetical protein n=1 Tax=Streptomyces sp. NPDC002688 TaxID=3154423 RepID=UPI00333117E1